MGNTGNKGNVGNTGNVGNLGNVGNMSNTGNMRTLLKQLIAYHTKLQMICFLTPSIPFVVCITDHSTHST